MKFGAHISTAAPFSAAISRAEESKCECMQIFVNAPQRWKTVSISAREMERFVELNKSARIEPIISHSIYLISLAGLNPFFYEASKKSLIDEMEKGKKLGLLGVNTHLGSSKDHTFYEVKEKIILAIDDILEAVPAGPHFIIENSAGAGNIIGDTLDEIGEIVKGVGSDRVKVIIDTAHAFESGYPIQTAAGLDNFLVEFEEKIGLGRLVGLHLNDSQTAFDSKNDRHADIGEGEIGLKPFERIVNHPKLKDLFGIIETSGIKGKSNIDNLQILKSLQEQK